MQFSVNRKRDLKKTVTSYNRISFMEIKEMMFKDSFVTY